MILLSARCNVSLAVDLATSASSASSASGAVPGGVVVSLGDGGLDRCPLAVGEQVVGLHTRVTERTSNWVPSERNWSPSVDSRSRVAVTSQ